MKKTLILLSVLLLILLAVAACTNASDTEGTDPAATSADTVLTEAELPTDTEEVPDSPTDSATEAPTETPTEAPTVPPEWLTYTETEKDIYIPTEEATEAPTEPVGDTSKPVTLIDAEQLNTEKGKYHMDNGIVVNDGYITIVPSGEDPYYYPAYNFLGARYIIIKYRTATCDGIYMQLYLASSGTGPQDDSTMLEDRLIGDGEWHYLVIDTKPLIDKGKFNGKDVSYLRFDPLDPGYLRDENGNIITEGTNKLRGTMPDDASIDVAYIAFCNAPDTMQNMGNEA